MAGAQPGKAAAAALPLARGLPAARPGRPAGRAPRRGRRLRQSCRARTRRNLRRRGGRGAVALGVLAGAAKDGGEAGRARAQGAQAALGRAAGRAGMRSRGPAACAGGGARRQRWHGGVPAAATPDLSGKEVGRVERAMEKLTTASNRTEKGREVRLDGGAELGGQQWWPRAAQGPIRPVLGANGFGEGRRSFGARSRGLGRGESKHGGERWPESALARRAACS